MNTNTLETETSTNRINNQPSMLMTQPNNMHPINSEAVEITDDFVVGEMIQPKRLKGSYDATLVTVKKKDVKAGKGTSTQIILCFELDEKRADNTPYYGEYIVPNTWRHGNEFQTIAAQILNRSLTKPEISGQFRPTTLRGKRCQVDVTEHRKRDGNGLSTIHIKSIKAISDSVVAQPGMN